MPTKQHRRPAYPIFRVMKDIPAGEPPPAQLAPLLPCLDLEPALLLEILEYGGCRALDIPGEAGGKPGVGELLKLKGLSGRPEPLTDDPVWVLHGDELRAFAPALHAGS